MKANILLFPLLLLTMISCGPSRTKEINRINAAETRIFSPKATSIDKEAADSLLVLYSAFIKDFPADSMTKKYIFKAGSLNMNSGNGKAAIEMFDLYRSSYPNDPRSAICLFFTAYIYENMMKNLDKAQELYILFIEKYPHNDFADDAQNALNNLGKTPEQMVKEFEQRKQADSARAADSLRKSGRKRK